MSNLKEASSSTAQMDETLLRNAQLGEFARIQKWMENINEHLGNMSIRLQAVEHVTTSQGERPKRGSSRIKVVESEEGESDKEEEFDNFREGFPKGAARRERGMGRRDRGHSLGGGNRGHQEGESKSLGSLKLKLPQFQGRIDPESYLEWEKRMELIFECHQYSEITKVRIAVTQFTEYAIAWWDQVMTSRRRSLEHPVDNWHDLKSIMRKRFVPKHYHRELTQKLQYLRQGSKSVDDYYKEMEVLMTRVDLVEEEETTMARFLAGLNKELADRVDL